LFAVLLKSEQEPAPVTATRSPTPSTPVPLFAVLLKRRQLMAMPFAAGVVLAQGKTEGALMSRVRVEIFSDFQCPGCKSLHESTVNPLRDEYVASGKVQLVHHEFPLPMHAYAREAACLACAADKLGLYRKVSDALFHDQEIWSANGQLDAALAKVLKPAELTKLKALAKDPAVVAQVESDLALGKRVPIDQTPTMLVTFKGKSQPVKGAISYPIFKRYIDSLLAMQ
jgi:protein-disulfide isomerase